MRIGFLASHRGSNMQAVLDACAAGKLEAEPVMLVTNNRGAEAIQRAQLAGMAVHVLNGVTHPDPDLLDAEYDHGRVLAQTEVPVLPADTAESLAERVLEKEHEFLPCVLSLIARGDLRLGEQTSP